MFKKLRSYLMIGLVGLVTILLLTWTVLDYYLPTPPKEILASVGIKNGSNESFAKQYQTILARSGVTLEIHNSAGTGENIERLSDPKLKYQLGFATDGIADGSQAKNLLSLGEVTYLPYWIFYRSTKEWVDLDALKGKRIAVGAETTGRYKLAQALHLGVNTPPEDLVLSGESAIQALRKGKVDAILTSGAFTLPSVQDLLRDPSIRVLNFPRAEALTKIFPQLRHLVLPAGIIDFEKNIPPHDVHIIAASSSILVRQDLHPQIIYLLAQALEEVHGGFGPFNTAGTFPTQFDSGYPMSSIARDYYKNGPSFLNKYLPFWMTSYILRLLATLATIMAIALPLFKFLPKLYGWYVKRYTDQLFQGLRILHIDLRSATEPKQLKAIEGNLNEIERTAHLLPMRHTDLYFSLIGKIDSERKLLEKKLSA